MSGYTNIRSTVKLTTYELNNIHNHNLKTNMIENEDHVIFYPVNKLTLVKNEKEDIEKRDCVKCVDLSDLDADKLEYDSEDDEVIMSLEKLQKKKVQKEVRCDPVKKQESASKEIQVDLSEKLQKKVHEEVQSDPVKEQERVSKEVQVDLSKKEEKPTELGRNMRANKKIKDMVLELRLKQKQKLKELVDDNERFDKKLQRETDIKKNVDITLQ